jgi:hypothetical protein
VWHDRQHQRGRDAKNEANRRGLQAGGVQVVKVYQLTAEAIVVENDRKVWIKSHREKLIGMLPPGCEEKGK